MWDFAAEKVPLACQTRWRIQLTFWKCSQVKQQMPGFSERVLNKLGPILYCVGGSLTGTSLTNGTATSGISSWSKNVRSLCWICIELV